MGNTVPTLSARGKNACETAVFRTFRSIGQRKLFYSLSKDNSPIRSRGAMNVTACFLTDM